MEPERDFRVLEFTNLIVVTSMTNVSIEFATMLDLWQFVLAFEDGTLPATAWNERTVATAAVWYLSMHTVDEAVARLEAAVQRNRRRFRNGVVEVSSLWPRILQHVLMAASERDPLPLANRLMRERGTVLASRVA